MEALLAVFVSILLPTYAAHISVRGKYSNMKAVVTGLLSGLGLVLLCVLFLWIRESSKGVLIGEDEIWYMWMLSIVYMLGCSYMCWKAVRDESKESR